MKLFYLHHTPLAALLALEQVGRIPRDGWSSYLGNLQREAYRAGFLAAGRDGTGCEVFALWYRARLDLLCRLVQSFLHLLAPEHADIRVKVVRYPGIRAAAGIFLCRLGLRWAGNLCLRLWPGRLELTAKSYGCIIGAKFTRRPGEKTDEEKRASRR